MSTKTTSKPKKETREPRPKSNDRRGKRNPTPDQTDSEGRGEDDGKATKTIINDEILSLQIKQEDLDKLRENLSPEEEYETRTVTVRRVMSPSQVPPRRIRVSVAKPAPRDASLKKMSYRSGHVPRMNADGRIVPYSLLGTIDDYLERAEKKNELPDSFVPINDEQENALTVSDKIKKPILFPQYESAEKSKALDNWEKHMKDRKYQQSRLAAMLNKHPSQLVMNESEAYRSVAEQRHLIDRTLHTVGKGKGYRTGSEFWAQPEVLGEEDDGMRMTLTQTQKGYPAPIEHVGHSLSTLYEKGMYWGENGAAVKPWHQSEYLRWRQWQLKGAMKELYSHKPELEHLEIIGQSVANASKKPVKPGVEVDLYGDTSDSESDDNLDSDPHMETCPADSKKKYQQSHASQKDPFPGIPDVEPDQVMGPSLLFAGQPARWSGDSTSHVSQVGIDARVSFEIYAGKRVVSFLDLTNDGTTAIQYVWKKVHRPNPFQLQHNNVQRFYFNTTEGTILPGEALRVPFVFKSPNAGVFQEQWQILTKPVLCGGAKIIVTLRGIALQEDKHGSERSDIEMTLKRRQVQGIVEEILNSLVNNIKEPERCRSPVDAYITDEQRFTVANPSLAYQYEKVQELRSLFANLTPDPENYKWDYSIETIQALVAELDEDNDEKQDILERFNNIITDLNFPPRPHENRSFYTLCYQSLCGVVDRFVEQAMTMQHMMGLPEREGADLPTDLGKKSQQKLKIPAASQKPSKEQTTGKSAQSVRPSPAGSSSNPSASRASLTAGQSSTKGGVSSKVIVSKPDVVKDENEEDGPDLSKYNEAIYNQMYMFLCEAVDDMCHIFEEQDDLHGGPTLPKMI